MQCGIFEIFVISFLIGYDSQNKSATLMPSHIWFDPCHTFSLSPFFGSDDRNLRSLLQRFRDYFLMCSAHNLRVGRFLGAQVFIERHGWQDMMGWGDIAQHRTIPAKYVWATQGVATEVRNSSINSDICSQSQKDLLSEWCVAISNYSLGIVRPSIWYGLKSLTWLKLKFLHSKIW